MNEAETVCVREREREERRVKVVIDGRPGLRPLPYSGQRACLCQRLQALPPSIPVFISLSNSPTQCYCIVSLTSLMPFNRPLLLHSLLSPSCWHPHRTASHPLKCYCVKTTTSFKVNSHSKTQKHVHFINPISC